MTTRSVQRSGERKRHRVGGRRLEHLHAKDKRTPPLPQDEVVGKRLAFRVTVFTPWQTWFWTSSDTDLISSYSLRNYGMCPQNSMAMI